MRKLLPIFIASMVLVIVSDHLSAYRLDRLGGKKYIRKERVLYMFAAVAMAMFVGLRVSYNDTFTYRRSYELAVSGWQSLNSIDWTLGSNPGYAAVMRVLKTLGISTQSYLMIYALVTICICMWFIHKYSDCIWLSVFFFFAMGLYTFSMAAVKQMVAMAFCLIATDRAIGKKWIPFCLWVIIGALFHPYALMYLIAPLLMLAPWTKRTYWMMAVFGAIGLGLQTVLSGIVNITSMMGEEYTVASFSGEGVNPFRLAVVWVPVVLSYLVRGNLRKNDDRASNLIMNFTMLNAEIMFVALFGTANYFARLANYFLVFQTISLPWLFKYFKREDGKILIFLAVVCYLAYFYYSNVILYGGFDINFKYIHFLEYIKFYL